MKKTILLIFSLSLFITSASGQKIFREGYILKKTGETFTGLVEFSPNQKIPETCNFKRFDIALSIMYSPVDIIEFGYLNGRRFISINHDNKDNFFEVLVSGQITLFKKGSGYYLRKNNQELVELKNDDIKYNDNGALHNFDGPQDFLRYITEERIPVIKDEFDLKTDLIPVITEFNKLSGTSYKVYKREFSEKELNIEANKSQAYRTRLGVTAGISSYSLKLTPLSEEYVPIPENELTVLFGIKYEKMLSRKNDRLSLNPELLFLKQNFYCYNKISQSNGRPIYDDTFFEFSGIKLPILIQYSFTGRRIVPFLSAGPSFTIFLNKDYVHTREFVTTNSEIMTLEDKKIAVGKYEVTGILNAGVRTRVIAGLQLSLQGRIEIGNGIFDTSMSSTNDFKQMSIQSSVLIGISF